MKKINTDILRLEDILQAIKNIEEFNSSSSNDSAITFATAYCVAIIGEAANNLSLDLRNSNSHIEWHSIIGTRHKIIHDYGKLDEEILSEIVTTHLPILKNQITMILDKLLKESLA